MYVHGAGKRSRLPQRLLVQLVHFLVALLCVWSGSRAEASGRPLRFVGDRDYPPIEFSENGVARGLYVDIVRALGQAGGREVAVELLEWEKAQQMVRDADADAVGLLAVTDERRSRFDFTDTVMELEYSLFVRSDLTGISELNDLRGRIVGVTAGGLPRQVLKAETGISTVVVADYRDGLQRLEKGTIQAFAADKWVALYYLQQEGIGNVKALDRPLATRKAAIAVGKGNLQLVEELNRGLAQLKNRGVLREIQARWSGKRIVLMTREKVERTIAMAVSAFGLLLIVCLFFWIHTLKRQIAERKRAENSIKESEGRFRNIFDNSPMAIGIGEIESGKLIEVNGAWLRLLGYELGEVIGRTTSELGLYADGRERDEVIRTIRENGRIVNKATRFRNKSGEVLDALYFAEIFTLDARPYLQVMMVDVTEQKRVEAQLSKGRLEIYNLFNNSAVAMFRSRYDGSETINANEKFLEIVGRSREEVIGKPSCLLWVDPGRRAEMLRRLDADGRVIDFEFQMINKDGSVRDCLTSLTLFVEEGVLDGSIVDVTERKKAEASLLRSEARYRELVEGTSDLVTQVDAGGRFLFVNRNALRYFGCPAAECIGRAAFDFVHPDDRAGTLDAFKRWTQQRLHSTTFENRQIGLNGEVHDMLWTINFYYDGENLKQINSIARDITERRKLQDEQLKNQKLESLGVLAGGIAHDFNNILTGIVGSISLARMFLDESHQATALLVRAADACQRAAELARQLLTFAKGSKPIRKTVSSRRLVEASASLVLHGSNVQGVLNIPDGLDDLEVDEGQISQAFNNIIINASQAMPGGGTVTITAENASPDEVERSSLPGGRYVKFSFSDTGCGISEENRKKVFDPYFTTKASGNGLGLASVHSIVNKHGGGIKVRSRVGAGTTFELLLPASDRKAPEKESPAVRSKREPTCSPVLVMDDEEIIRNLAAEILEVLGYRAQTCCDGEAAIALYREAMAAGTPFAFVIMDLTIPGKVGGQEAARRILEFDPGACLVVSSGYSHDPILAEYGKFGFSAVLAKPYNLVGVEQVVDALASKRGKN